MATQRRAGITPQHTPGTAALLAAFLLAAASGCHVAAGGGKAPESGAPGHATAELGALLAGGEPLPHATLRVRLAFGGEADLDLFVTDPLQETVYFANTPSRSGGELAADLRCDAPAPRLEQVVYASPLPGRYRVGVDYPESCPGGRGAVRFAVMVEHAGRRTLQQGELRRGEFEPVVLEIDIGVPSGED